MPTQTEPATISQALSAYGQYPEDHPQTLTDLVSAEPDTITHPLAWFLRKQAIATTRASEKHHIRGPADVMKLLSNKYVLHPWDGKWVSYALNADREVILVTDDSGRTKSLRKATQRIPRKEDLPDIPASAWRGSKRPAWLVIFGGNPDVLDKEFVARGLATLQRTTSIADICFYECDPDAELPPTLWSVRAGVGMSTGDAAVPFPTPETLEEVRNYEERN
jgi:hypothetical protein